VGETHQREKRKQKLGRESRWAKPISRPDSYGGRENGEKENNIVLESEERGG